MLQEAIDLQQNAVVELVNKLKSKKEITFRAPTGSGKTRMMADFMNRVIEQQPEVVFLVSTLSKGNLAEQNYKVFRDCAERGIFPHLHPHLISTELAEEEGLFIPLDYNVYVLPRDLYKSGGRLMQGAMMNFLDQITSNLFGGGMNKTIYLIKDECHQATNNLDNLSAHFFSKTINFSATPNLKRGQNPDVEISDEEAVAAKLIKEVQMGSDEDTVEKAICKFEEIKEDYRNLLGVNPCLIIQISNKDKAEQEWANIESILTKTEHQHLKWMSIVDKKEKCKTNDKLGKLPVAKWKDYAKENASTIDIIVFKMVISEGWDIPRACMLYQVRDTQSKQLDEQVMGRVRRNPRLLDYEHLSKEAQELAMTAWVWGIPPDSVRKSYQVKLYGNLKDIPDAVKIKTTRLKPLTERADFDVSKFLETMPTIGTHSSIFEVYRRLQKCNNDVKKLCYEYADGDIMKWWLFGEYADKVRKSYEQYICDYAQSMEIVKDENGMDKEVSFPMTSMCADNQHYVNISDWVWKRKDGHDRFSFDSEAEREWASILKDLSRDEMDKVEVGEFNPDYKQGQLRTDGTTEPIRLSDESKFLWGKNFLMNSEIRFEYYLNGVHNSYPDFVMKDRQGYLHLFEVKSVNVSNASQFDSEEYKTKVNALKECYKQCSKLTDYAFYLPVLKDESWHIYRYLKGEEDTLSKEGFINAIKTPAAMRYNDN
jgi:type III restriction enzyme